MVLSVSDLETKFNTIINAANPGDEARAFYMQYSRAPVSSGAINMILKFIRQHNTGVLSLNSGTGLWENFINKVDANDNRSRGLNIVCTDNYVGRHYTKIYEMSPARALIEYPGTGYNILFLCCSLSDCYRDIIKLHRPRRYLIIIDNISELPDQCRDYLKNKYNHVESHRLLNFPGQNNMLHFYERIN